MKKAISSALIVMLTLTIIWSSVLTNSKTDLLGQTEMATIQGGATASCWYSVGLYTATVIGTVAAATGPVGWALFGIGLLAGEAVSMAISCGG